VSVAALLAAVAAVMLVRRAARLEGA